MKKYYVKISINEETELEGENEDEVKEKMRDWIVDSINDVEIETEEIK